MRETGLRMSLLDRDELLARTDLSDLATQICGPAKGRGRSARWHCPNPEHPDEHPSMGIYLNGHGLQRWKCHSCGEGGTAVDLLMISTSMSAGEALRDLAQRAGIDPGPSRPGPNHTTGGARGRATTGPPTLKPPVLKQPAPPAAHAPAIERFVAAAERLLTEPVAGLAQRKLRERGLSEPILRANRIGFDPGPAVLPRPKGLPRRSPGIVYPVLDPQTGQAIYYQVRSLSPRDATDHKYDQPSTAMAPNPKIAAIRSTQAQELGLLAITEGIPDGLTAVQAGARAVAVLGVSHAGTDTADDLARKILTEHPSAAYAVCFDPDRAGLVAGNNLADRLAHHGAAVAKILPPRGLLDLNAWWQADRHELAAQLTSTPAVLAI
jgi:DNA primase